MYRSPSWAVMKISLVAFKASAAASCDAVGVGAVRLTVAIEAERRNDGNNTLVQQRLKKFSVDTLDLSGKQVVDTLDDPERMRNDGIRGRRRGGRWPKGLPGSRA